MAIHIIHRFFVLPAIGAGLACVLSGCAAPEEGGSAGNDPPAQPRTSHATTRAVDAYNDQLADLKRQADHRARLGLYLNRWSAVQRAVAHQGTTHRDAFYGSRAYWHTGSARGLGWALDHRDDLTDPVYVDGEGNVRIAGDAKADIEVTGSAIVHILGDLDATLELKGVCEVVVAGTLTRKATIVCDGQLDLYVGGDSLAVLGATGGATIVIDGDAAGTLQCGAPATYLTITGDLGAEIPAPRDKNAVLTLRVDGYAPTAAMLDLANAGFTRINATLAKSNAPPGLYPRHDTAGAMPKARWVVLEQVDRSD